MRLVKKIEFDKLHLFLISRGNQIGGYKYLESLEIGTELIVAIEEQIQKLTVYYDIKRYLWPLFIIHLLNDFNASSYKQYFLTRLAQIVLNFEQASVDWFHYNVDIYFSGSS